MSLEGQLGPLQLSAVLQMIAASQWQAKLVLLRGQDIGVVHFGPGGRILHAEAAGHEGDGAVVEMLAWREGFFRATTHEPPQTCTVAGSLSEMIVQAVRARDESSGNPSASLFPTPRTPLTNDSWSGPLVELLSTCERHCDEIEKTGTAGHAERAVEGLASVTNAVLAFCHQIPELALKDTAFEAAFERAAERWVALHLARALGAQIDIAPALPVLVARSREAEERATYGRDFCRGLIDLGDLYLSHLADCFSDEETSRQWREAFSALAADLSRSVELIRF